MNRSLVWDVVSLGCLRYLSVEGRERVGCVSGESWGEGWVWEIYLGGISF